MKLLHENEITAELTQSRVKVLPVVHSTNQYLLDLIHTLHSGDTCVAEYQKAGRGRRGSNWVSPFGVNICLSMFWRLNSSSVKIIGISLVIGIAIAELLRDLGAVNVKLKWPNDIYLNNKKLAGILIEIRSGKGHATNIVIGVGINMSMRTSGDFALNHPWINLQEAGVTINRNQLVAYLLNRLHHTLVDFEENGLAPFIERWNKLDHFMHKPVSLMIGNNIIYGIACGIDSNGALLLYREGIIVPFLGYDISLRRT
ncbi:Bifunctional protein BirA [Candidatus Profftia tarda]|uniref:Bifunctional protein BirA n=1 Tax=Candidatus Profftia tarda TaxID=1177216 RepID=A0A8E4GHN9_9ENTR|nr:Bifunctional protein BirA [Candidatus Profftia tarda]